MAAVSLPFHVIKKQDLEDYIMSLALEKGCPVSNIDRTKAHWEFIMHKEQCMSKVIRYREAGEFSCSICGKQFKHRTSRNRHRRKVNCGNKAVVAGGVKCTTCNKLFNSTSTRNRHQRTVHKAIADS